MKVSVPCDYPDRASTVELSAQSSGAMDEDTPDQQGAQKDSGVLTASRLKVCHARNGIGRSIHPDVSRLPANWTPSFCARQNPRFARKSVKARLCSVAAPVHNGIRHALLESGHVLVLAVRGVLCRRTSARFPAKQVPPVLVQLELHRLKMKLVSGGLGFPRTTRFKPGLIPCPLQCTLPTAYRFPPW